MPEYMGCDGFKVGFSISIGREGNLILKPATGLKQLRWDINEWDRVGRGSLCTSPTHVHSSFNTNVVTRYTLQVVELL